MEAVDCLIHNALAQAFTAHVQTDKGLLAGGRRLQERSTKYILARLNGCHRPGFIRLLAEYSVALVELQSAHENGLRTRETEWTGRARRLAGDMIEAIYGKRPSKRELTEIGLRNDDVVTKGGA